MSTVRQVRPGCEYQRPNGSGCQGLACYLVPDGRHLCYPHASSEYDGQTDAMRRIVVPPAPREPRPRPEPETIAEVDILDLFGGDGG